MKIDPTVNAAPVNQPVAPTPAPTRTATRQDEVSLQQSEGLNQALTSLPAVRPEVVEQARALINDTHYPPLAVINSISHLIAARLKPYED